MLTAPTDGHQAGPHRYPSVIATRYAPAGQRERWVFAVSCPMCQQTHLHWFADGVGGARRAGCGGGVYWVAVTEGGVSRG